MILKKNRYSYLIFYNKDKKMTNKGKSVVSGLALSAVLALTGCGGGDDSSTSASTTTVGTGYYVDSAVAGVDYKCGDQNGTTDSKGMFKFQVGESCTFSLNDVILRQVLADMLVDDGQIVEDNVTVARFLQTLDSDGDALNGIQITSEIKTALKGVALKQIPVDDAALATVFNSVKSAVADYNGTMVSVEDAKSHLEETLTNATKSLLAGKTFYIVHIDEQEHFVGEVNFNADMTQEKWSGIINDSGTETDTISVKGDKIVWSDNSYTLIKQYPQYILGYDYNENGADGKSYFFDSKAAAEDYYYRLYPKTPDVTTPTVPTTTTTSLSGTPIVPYTVSATVGGALMELGADGQFKVEPIAGMPVLVFTGSPITVSQLIQEDYISGDWPIEGSASLHISSDFAKGTQHIVGRSEKYGSADCVDTYPSPLPFALNSADDVDSISFNDDLRISTTCPDWVHAESTTNDLPTSLEILSNKTITSSTGTVSFVSMHFKQ
jgi:hypothetical protein